MRHLFSCLFLFSIFSFTTAETKYSLSFDEVDDSVMDNSSDLDNLFSGYYK